MKYTTIIALTASLIVLAWCTNTPTTTTPLITESTNISVAAQPKIIELQDGDTYDMNITEVTKTINGQTLRMLAYNGSIPWPILKAPKWSKVTIKLTNHVGDITTTLHSHGLRGDNTQDGVPKDMWWHDTPIWSGQMLTYVLEFPDSGVFWYHPHVREDLQQELGLYGNFLVMSSTPAPVNREETIMLDDLFVNRNGQIVPFDPSTWNYVLMGRYGNIPLINGETNYQLKMKAWEVVRLYLTNAANVTPFNLTFSGLNVKLVGGDIGNYEHEEMITNLVIVSAERYIVDMYAPLAGTYTITNQIGDESYSLAQIVVNDNVPTQSYKSQFDILATDPTIISDIDQYRKYFDRPVDKTLVLDVEMEGMMWDMMMWDMMWHGDWNTWGPIALPWWLTLDPSTIERSDTMPMMNKDSTTENTSRHLVDKDTGKRDMDINRSFTRWDVIKVRIYNDPESAHPMQHPVHFHGQRFLVLDKNGQTNNNLVRKDTVLVPTGEYVDVLIDMSNPGTRMAHCHIAEHLTAGMMMSFEVK